MQNNDDFEFEDKEKKQVLDKEQPENPSETFISSDENENEESPTPVIVDEEELLELAAEQGLVEASASPTLELLEEEESESKTKQALTETEENEIMASIEAILFMSDKPVSLPKLRSIINPEISLNILRTLMAKLREEFARDLRGVEIAEFSLGFQLRTKPQMSSVLRKMVKTTPLKLSPTNMEVLSIIAYKQPVTKDEIDQIRGVDSGYVIRNLMEKRLVKITGRSDLPGKPMVYSTTHEFLELFNLKDTKSLPSLHEVEAMVAASEVGFEEKVDAVMDGFSKMVQSSTKILFDDSQIDEELEALRAEIARVPTSTEFLDEQRAKEKRDAKIAELALEGLTLDANDKVVPIGSIPLAEVSVEVPEVAASTSSSEIIEENILASEHIPSEELAQAAKEAELERHAEMLEETLADAAPSEETNLFIEQEELKEPDAEA